MKTKINLPNIWGQGALFAYCGAEGKCSYITSLVGTLMADRLGIQFRNLANNTDRVYFVVNLDNEIWNVHYKAVTSDMICADIEGIDGSFFGMDIVFVNQTTIVLKSKTRIDAKLVFDYDIEVTDGEKVTVYNGNQNRFAIAKTTDNTELTVAISYGENAETDAVSALSADIDEIISRRVEFYESIPAPTFHDTDEERLFYKCVSILRSTIYTPEGKIDYHALTPDRFPHRGIWLWDTAYIVIGLKYMYPEIAKEAVLAILQCSQPDGFLPHMTKPDGHSDITQPPTIAWAALSLYNHTGDKKFLEECFDRLCAYVLWDIKNRDINGNGLPEWEVGDDPFCRCDESGMDNTPRFDEATEMDCIDFAAFLANDMRCLAEIAKIIGRNDKAAEWQSRYNEICGKINTILWDDTDEFYYDRKLCDDKFHKVKSVASFITLFAGVCDEEKAAKMVEHLKNPNEFGTEFPVPTVSADDKTYPTKDMFRGTVWLNFNILIADGLRRYGYIKEAEELEEKTVKTIKQWYLNDGIVYEFYDSKNEVSPSRLSRKGIALQPFAPELKMQSVRDFSWGACAVIEFLLNRK